MIALVRDSTDLDLSMLFLCTASLGDYPEAYSTYQRRVWSSEDYTKYCAYWCGFSDLEMELARDRSPVHEHAVL